MFEGDQLNTSTESDSVSVPGSNDSVQSQENQSDEDRLQSLVDLSTDNQHQSCLDISSEDRPQFFQDRSADYRLQSPENECNDVSVKWTEGYVHDHNFTHLDEERTTESPIGTWVETCRLLLLKTRIKRSCQDMSSEDRPQFFQDRSSDYHLQCPENECNDVSVQWTKGFVQDQNFMRQEEEERTGESPIGTWDSEDDEAALENLKLMNKEEIVDEVIELLPTARRFGRNNLVTNLVAVLMNSLSVTNCVTIFQLASWCELEDLRAASHDMICRNFVKVSGACAEFCNLSLEELCFFIYSDYLVATEEQVFEAIRRWIITDLCGRQCFISTLLPGIRVDRCSKRFLRNSIAHFLVEDEHSFLAAARERIQLLNSEECSLDHFGTEDFPRAGSRNIIFVMGGLYGANIVETLDPTRSSWVAHNIPDAPSKGTWICSIDHQILVLEEEKRRFRSFDVQTRRWTQLRSPNHYRMGSSGSHSGYHVYVVGGVKPHGKRCDRYNVFTDQWDVLAPMIEMRKGAASVCHAGKLYCSGGLSGPTERFLSSVEFLDLQENGQWSRLPPMCVGRSNHSLVSCGGFLWAIGGWNGGESLIAVEKFDLEEYRWKAVRSLDTPRSYLSASVIGGQIHAIGGDIGGFDNVSTVEVYDNEEDDWTCDVSLRVERCFHGSCVVQFLSDADADQYATPIQ